MHMETSEESIKHNLRHACSEGPEGYHEPGRKDWCCLLSVERECEKQSNSVILMIRIYSVMMM